ncbi:uncharacterized protein LTR77_004902 [Saxophila tyrrhenica]|uniref:Uncharacterized protein n=1 Tax=Saxophila tyrrhenica TaxID=1690608 RepID=A0AAV9PDK9_9PEZI|nr:hypothetical protein LTR77_004902 [Saxophila tyrrhenica]
MSFSAPPDLPSLFTALLYAVHGVKMRLSQSWPAPAAGRIAATSTTSSAESGLVPLVFEPLPLGSIQPTGWFKDQMQLMADGLAGHEHDFYNYVAHSSWLGRDMEYSDLNEGLPYWFNGMVYLAYGLNDERLKDQVHSAAGYILDHQWDDGWIGPENKTARNFWGRMPLFLGMTGLAEANATWEAKIVPALHKFNDLMNTMLNDNYTGYWYQKGDVLNDNDTDWGRIWHQDMLITLQWLYEHHRGDQGQMLLENMKMLHDCGLNWEDWYNQQAYFGQGIDKDLNTINSNLTDDNYAYEHGVNVAQAQPALGDNYYADRAERVAFNAIPAMATPDWWGHQYMEQPNQPEAANLSSSPFYNTNSWGATFGLEPNYPCCTVNHPQGFPKFLANSYVKVGANGLAHALLSPGSASATLRGNKVTVKCDTAYPFLDTLTYTIDAEAPFDFYVRLPGWATIDASIKVNSEEVSPILDSETGMQKISLDKGSSTVAYYLPSTVRTESRENNTVSVYKGSVLYALEVTNHNTSTPPKPYDNPGFGDEYFNKCYYPPQSRDWSYHNTSRWNYAIDPETLQYHSPDSSSTSLANPLFGAGGPPGYVTAKACEIEWAMAFNGSVPGYPPNGEKRKCVGKVEKVKLVPYASARTHIAELPVLDLGG